jgi:Tfp pilus assembly protein PilF
LNPPGPTPGAEAEKARRRFKLAEKLFQAKSYEKALENVNESIDKDRTVAAAHTLKGQILDAQGNKEAARGAFAEALKLEPANAGAAEGMKKASEK